MQQDTTKNEVQKMRKSKGFVKIMAVMLSVIMLAGMLPVAAGAASGPPDIFTMKTMSYGGSGNGYEPTTLILGGSHYGRPIVSIPCTYRFYVMDAATRQVMPSVFDDKGHVYNIAEVTLPSNAGSLYVELDVLLPPGGYLIYYY